MRMGDAAARGLGILLDVLIVLAAAAAVAIVLTGGGRLDLAGMRISATRPTNAVIAAWTLVCLRVIVLPHVPLAFSRVSPDGLAARVVSGLGRTHAAMLPVSSRRAPRMVLGLIAVSALVKIANAWIHFGFFAGDDVEVHEMTLAYLLGWEGSAWNLRSPVFPFVFILPVQAVAVALGVSDIGLLVFLGRLVVVAASSLVIWLAFVVGRDVLGSPGGGLLAAAFLATSRLHTHFGSTELPRTVAAVFLLLAFTIPVRSLPSGLAAGAWIAAAGVLRFGEFVFAGAEIAWLVVRRRSVAAIGVLLGCALVAVPVIGLADYLYWGEAWSSLRNAFDYTVVRGLSSRGYEPWHYYLSAIGAWTNPVWAALAIASAWAGYWRLAAWTWIPVAILSLLPHKEARYLVPVVPFLSIGAAAGLLHLVRPLEGRELSSVARRAVLVAVAACGAALVFEIGGFRFRRSEAAVQLARQLAPCAAGKTIVIEQAWRFGGRLHFANGTRVVDAGSLPPGDLRALLREPDVVTVALNGAEIQDLTDEVLADEGFRPERVDEESGYRVATKCRHRTTE